MWKETSPVLSVAFARGILLSIACTSQNLNRFLFRDASRYIRYVARSGNFLCNLYAIRLHRHLLLRMHSHLKQLRSLVKKKIINSYLYFFNCASFQLVLEYRTLQLDIMPY